MSWVRPDREIILPDLPHTSEHSAVYGGSRSEALLKVYRTHRVLNPGPVVCESITLTARPQMLLLEIVPEGNRNLAVCV